jgi:hypothetical protein
MTLILSYVTEDLVLLASDRRLTQLPSGALADDNANKATVFCGRIAIGYTGLAQIKLQRTDEWLTNILIPVRGGLSEAVNTIREEATRYFSSIAASPTQKRHAFLAVGWTRSNPEQRSRPFLYLISNFHEPSGVTLPAAGEQFKSMIYTPEPARLPLLHAIPRPYVSDDEGRQLHAALVSMVEPQEIGLALAGAIRSVASRDQRVGKNILVVCLPRSVIEQESNPLLTVSGSLSRAVRGSVYLPENSSEVIQYAPNLVCSGFAFIRSRSGPIPENLS